MDIAHLRSVEGPTTLITGGSRGIGKKLAAGFIMQGANAYISFSKVEACHEAAKELGPNCIAVPVDVATVEGCHALAGAIIGTAAPLDILFNALPPENWTIRGNSSPL